MSVVGPPATGASTIWFSAVSYATVEALTNCGASAPESSVRWWQDHLTPAWKHLSGGCHLNRAIDELVENAGFRIERLDRGYMRGPKPMTFTYEGSARPQ